MDKNTIIRIVISICLLLCVIFFGATANVIGQTCVASLCIVLLFFDDWNGGSPTRYA